MKQIRLINDLELVSAVKAAQSVFITTHIRPDGDAIGSLLAMKLILTDMGKTVVACTADPVPEVFLFLPGAAEIVRPDQVPDPSVFDTAIALDCSDSARMGAAEEIFRGIPVTVQLDHHHTNPLYAAHNEADGESSSTGCMVWRLMGSLGVEMTASVAVCLYTAVSSDTGNFCFSCTDEETFLCAADIASTGIDINSVARNIHLLQPVGHVRLLARALSSLALFCDGQCASMILDKKDFEEAHALQEHMDGIVNYGLNLFGVKMAFLIDASEEHAKKVSFRALPPYDVSVIASSLGGGGHVLASGCCVDMPLDELIHDIEDKMIDQIRGAH